jgi:type II secretory pathway pseudopilin PulG
MLLKRIGGSTIAEVVIAITIISICLAIAAKIFMQSSKSSITFNEVKDQTEFQSELLYRLRSDTLLPTISKLQPTLNKLYYKKSTTKDSVIHDYSLISVTGKILWRQKFYLDEK